VKVLKTDLDTLTTEVQDMKLQIEQLEADKKLLEANQSEVLMVENEKLKHYKNQDDALYSYEQSNAKDKAEIKELKAKLNEANGLTENYNQAYQLERNMSDMLIERVVATKQSCIEYKTVNVLDIIA